MVVQDRESQSRLLATLELASRGGAIIDPLVNSSGLMDGYLSRGYHTYAGRFGVLMAKPLDPNITFDEAYGNRFYISNLGWF